jgi:adenine-specific DNA-methyltransferase
MESLQTQYLSQVGDEHRKQYAQFFTPQPIANFMRKWVLSGETNTELFDPAFGLGAFFEDLLEEVRAKGMEVDSQVLEFYLAYRKRTKAAIKHANYLLEYGQRYANIICNPPYLKFQKFDQKESALEGFQKHFGIKLSGYTNIASAFLVKSIFELAKGGRLAYIMPPEFLNAGYGRQVKELLAQRRHLSHILQISCEQEAFPDATTSLCILLYDSAVKFSEISFYSVDKLSQLPEVLNTRPVQKIPYNTLNPSEKWGIYFTPSNECVRFNKKYLIPLLTYGHFSRGIATGANEFFVLRKSDVSRLALQTADYAGCITKSAQIVRPIFTQDDFNDLAIKDAPVYLLNVTSSSSPAARQYIHYGESRGFNQRYITRNRTPWYKMERRTSAPIMLNVFSRNGYKAVRNYSTVQSLTPFHCFYPNLFGTSIIDLLFLYLYSQTGHSILASSVRKYGNDLEKFEPNDLNRSLVPSEEFFARVPTDLVTQLMHRLSAGEDIQVEADLLFASLLGA